MLDHTESCSLWPKNVAVVAASSRGAPTSPMVGMMRGTSPDRYMREPSKS
jgi:hypothetical protein